jgi:hypothetical protein
MNKDTNYEYILFPLPLLQEIFKKPRTGFSEIFDFGIYKSASTQKVTKYDAIKQTLYCYYRGGLTSSLERKLNKLATDEIFNPDDEYSGFGANGNEFNPDEEINAISEYLENDNELCKEITEFHQLRQIKDVLNIKFDIKSVSDTYYKLIKEYSDFKDSPLVMIRKEMMFDFYLHEKSEYEKVLFATYAGIRSIIGNKKFCQTTQEMVFMRMVGAKNREALELILSDKKVKGIFNKYNVRYQREKILNELVARNFLTSKIGIKKRTYLSCTLSYDDLSLEIIEFIKEKNIKFKVKENKIKELEDKKIILRHLNK